MDRCNFDPQQRQTWLSLAEEAGLPVHCVHFRVSTDECIRRCENRSGHETVSPQAAKRVIFTVQRQFQLPTREEANFFKSYTTIRNGDEFNDAILMLLNAK
jgi:predicted kinase